MRELHLRLRSLSLDNVTCPDSERYPFLKELITLDKKLHANWEPYDHYVAEPAPKPRPRVHSALCPLSSPLHRRFSLISNTDGSDREFVAEVMQRHDISKVTAYSLSMSGVL